MERTGGKAWSLADQLSWMMLGEMTRMNYYLRGYMRIKKHQDKFVWPKTPWDESNKPTTYGSVAPEDQLDAIAYLRTLSPKPK